jgi:predicted enzyme related to lactoylglutathione lyase
MFALTNGVAWFEISAEQPTAAEKFYGDLFNWQFTKVPDAGNDYRAITMPGQSIAGALVAAGGDVPSYATFGVIVEDVEATCSQATAAGGKVVVKPAVNGQTGMTFAYLADPSGNLLGISSLPEGTEI